MDRITWIVNAACWVLAVVSLLLIKKYNKEIDWAESSNSITKKLFAGVKALFWLVVFFLAAFMLIQINIIEEKKAAEVTPANQSNTVTPKDQPQSNPLTQSNTVTPKDQPQSNPLTQSNAAPSTEPEKTDKAGPSDSSNSDKVDNRKTEVLGVLEGCEKEDGFFAKNNCRFKICESEENKDKKDCEKYQKKRH
jgi:hypothetical protein